MITYQEIYDILRKEKYSEALQQLPKNFLKEIAAYLEEKRTIFARESSKGLFSETLRMTRKQLDNTVSIVKELVAIRQRKILNLALTAAMTGISKKNSENLLAHEIELFEQTVKQLEKCQREMMKKLENHEEERESKNILIRFKEDVPAFLDEEGNELGPFKQEELANLPRQIALILVADNKAILIEET